MNRIASLLTSALLSAAPAAAGQFSVSGPGGNIPDPLGMPGAWNQSFNGAAFSSTVQVANSVTGLARVRLQGFHHSWRGDLHVYLRDPAGVRHNLIVRPGFVGAGAGDHGDFLLGDFDLVAAGGASLQQGGADLDAGDYALHFNSGAGQWTNATLNTPLGSITGPAGAWTLVIEDWATMDVGGLTGWTLEGLEPDPSFAFCFGDGLDPDVSTPCPCGNVGAAGHGCANSVDASGAALIATGQANPDSMTLFAAGMPAASAALFLQGDAEDDAPFGDGVRCAGGTLVRLRLTSSVAGAAQFPDVGDLSLSVRGGVTPGSGVLRLYQTYYRNASPAFCPPETFNVTNGWQLVW
jgi:hypothetical protein